MTMVNLFVFDMQFAIHFLCTIKWPCSTETSTCDFNFVILYCQTEGFTIQFMHFLHKKNSFKYFLFFTCYPLVNTKPFVNCQVNKFVVSPRLLIQVCGRPNCVVYIVIKLSVIILCFRSFFER